MHYCGNSKYWPFLMYWPLVSRTSMVSRKNTTVINYARSRAQSRVSIDFLCIVSKIHLAHGKSYEHGSAKNVTIINFARSHTQGRVSISFRAPSWKFKILDIPDKLAHGKS
ncbi:hypothetical protein B296_00039127 [Ensete ventricosum]|uniref:Uncharacterized protein n=1 Tax=Ensete ventricosum TaxID=4639 RepID=A0A426X1S5_ENSVE|nr:hypothetical protein B296_00039127 [Ensete ventricosum]